MPNTAAGEGNPQDPIIKKIGTGMTLEKDNSYFSVSAARWFVNAESNFFRQRTVTGVLDCTFATRQNPVEDLKVILGTYDLKRGQKKAPIFDTCIVPWRCYRGGRITLGIKMVAISNDTAAAKLLKEVAAAGATVAVTALSTVTGGVAISTLVAAGTALASGTTSILTSSDVKAKEYCRAEMCFDKDEVVSERTYILAHRGELLDDRALSIKKNNSAIEVKYNNQELSDGCWALLELQTSKKYQGESRPWEERQSRFKNLLMDTMYAWQTKNITSDTLKERLHGNIYDDLVVCRNLIGDDEVLTTDDVKKYKSETSDPYKAALKALDDNKPENFLDEIKNLEHALRENNLLQIAAAASYTEVPAILNAIADSYRRTLFRESLADRLASFVAAYQTRLGAN